MKFIVNVKQGPHGSLLIVTDKEIIGKIFEEDRKQLDLTKEFYKGEERSEKEVEGILKEAQHIHLTGNNSVTLGIKLGLINKKNILVVQSIKHAEAVMS